jgi:hypothetical protein
MTRTELINKIVHDLLNDGFSVHLNRCVDINGWSGWFDADDDNKEFVVSLDHPFGFETMIHEYCHYLQWKNKRPLWDSIDNTYGVLIDWFEDSEVSATEEELDQSFHDIILLEHDCEMMSLNFAIQNCIENFDPKRYIQAANLYLWHYHFNRRFRKKPNLPICATNAVDIMSTTFKNDYKFYLNLGNLETYRQDRIIQEYS